MAFIDRSKSKMKRFLHSFIYAWNGIITTAKKEVNFRIHLLASVCVIAFGIFFQINVFEWIVILLLIGGILSLELMNTAIERIVDMVTQKYHPLAKMAKDAGAGAVFIYAIISVIIGLLIFIPKMNIWQ